MKAVKILTIVFLMSVYAALASASQKKALIVLIERDPWLMVIGSDSPSFVFYDDGTIIYRKAIGKLSQYFSIKLDKRAREKLLKYFKPSEKYLTLKNNYELSTWTDQPNNELSLHLDGLDKKINIYGRIRDNDEVRTKIPKEALSLIDKIIKYDDSKAQKWLPEKIEIMVWPYDYAPEESIIWPQGWPDIEDPSTVKRTDDLYSIYLDSSKYEEFIKFLKKQKQKGAIEINGKKWAVSYRFPFP